MKENPVTFERRSNFCNRFLRQRSFTVLEHILCPVFNCLLKQNQPITWQQPLNLDMVETLCLHTSIRKEILVALKLV